MGNEDKTVKLEVRSRGDRGFRREGRLWTPDPVEESFTEEAAQRLAREPQLIVRRLDGKKFDLSDDVPVVQSPFSQDQPSGVRTTGASSEVRIPANPGGATGPSGATGATGSSGATAPSEPDLNQPARRR